MSDQHIIDIGGRDGHFGILILVFALLHSTIHQQADSARLQKSAASGHFMVCPEKRQFHSPCTSLPCLRCNASGSCFYILIVGFPDRAVNNRTLSFTMCS